MTRRGRPAAPPPDVRRCAIYTRKSTTMGLEQEFNSLDSQRESCLAYIQRQPGWQLVPQRYEDGGFTGATLDRPAFTRLMADVQARHIDVIVVYKVDRLSRSLLDFARVIEHLDAADASFVSVTQNFTTADAMGRLTMNMLMSFAEFERSIIAERTRDKIIGSRRKGKWTGGPVPLGYVSRDKKLQVDEREAQVVREAFTLFLERRQMASVGRLLSERGLLPRSSRRPGVRGERWTDDLVGRVLRNPIYAGFIRCDHHLVPGEHAALIAVETYHQVQSLLCRASPDPRAPRAGYNPAYVLRGLLRCGQCGQAMSPSSTKKSGTPHRYYRCSTRAKLGVQRCPATSVPADALEELVVRHIGTTVCTPGMMRQVESALAQRIDHRRREVTQQRAGLPAKLAAARQRVDALATQLEQHDGRAREVFKHRFAAEVTQLEQIEHRLAEVDRELAILEHAAKDTAWMLSALRDFSRVWDHMVPQSRCRLLRAVVDYVQVDEIDHRVEVVLVDFTQELPAPSTPQPQEAR